MSLPYILLIYSIPESKALINFVICNYPISQPLTCQLYKRGLNDTYLV
jgi:hypothetical protein